MAELKTRRKKSLTVLVAAGITLAGTGIAFAYWTATGSGTGAATTGTSGAFTVTSDAPDGAALTPGGPGQTVDFTVTNPGTGTLLFSNITVAVANANGSAWVATPGCSAADYTAVISTSPAFGEISGGGSQTGTATVTMINRAVNQDACQGVSVPLYFATNVPD